MNDIKRFSRKTVFKGYCFDLVVDKVLWPNRTKLNRDLIVHPGISVVVPLLDRNHMILLRQYRYGAKSVLWEIPAGTIGRRESALVCAKRELEEEIGYRAEKWKKLAFCFASPGFNTEIINCFAASELVKTKASLEDDEVLSVKVVSIEDVKKMIRTRKIKDAKSLVALFYFLMDGGLL